MQKISPCLWFDGKAEEAANFYVSTFRNSKITSVMRSAADNPSVKAGAVLAVNFELEGQAFIALNGGPMFQFSPAVSLFVSCANEQEVDELWARLTAEGQPSRCGWLTDKYGVSWQIIPAVLGEMLQDKDREKAKRVMQAMLQMVKIDIAGLKRAYDGDRSARA